MRGLIRGIAERLFTLLLWLALLVFLGGLFVVLQDGFNRAGCVSAAHEDGTPCIYCEEGKPILDD